MGITIDQLLGRRFPIFMGNGSLNARNASNGSWIPSSITRYLGGFDPNDSPKASEGYELGRLIDKEYFPKRKLGQAAQTMVDFADGINKEVHKGDSRDMGGPYEVHTDDMSRAYARLSEKLGIHFDYKFVNALQLHDVKEDFGRIKEMWDEFKNIRDSAKSFGLKNEAQGSKLIRAKIKEEREKYGIELQQRYMNFIESYTTNNHLNQSETAKLKQDAIISLGVVDWMTRHTEERFFFQSVYALHKLQSFDDYLKKQFNAQLEVMNSLGVNKGFEPREYLWMRASAKGLDRIALSSERKPRFSRTESKQLEQELLASPELQEMYGDVDFRGREMPRPYNLNILYRNFVTLNNLHRALNGEGGKTAAQKSQNSSEFEYLQLVLGIREELLNASSGIIDEMKQSYEGDLSRKDAFYVKTGIEKKARDFPSELEVITGDGAITRGTNLDIMPNKNWNGLDDIEMRENYRDVLQFSHLANLFSSKDINKFDIHSDRPDFRMFSIKGLTDGLKMNIKPRPY